MIDALLAAFPSETPAAAAEMVDHWVRQTPRVQLYAHGESGAAVLLCLEVADCPTLIPQGSHHVARGGSVGIGWARRVPPACLPGSCP
jgi:hypothetical protein